MKKVIFKLIKILFVCVLAIFIIYLFLTTQYAFEVFNDLDIKLNILGNMTPLTDVNPETINKLGNEIDSFADLLREEANKSIYKNDIQSHSLNDGHLHSIGEFFNPTGYSAWQLLNLLIINILSNYTNISIALGIVTALAYAIITSKSLNIILKLVLGYIGIILIFPPIYMYTWTFRFWSIKEMYFNSYSKTFYIVYTLIFILMYIINYIIGKTMTNKLNKAIKNK